MGNAKPTNRAVVCNCSGTSATGTYNVDGRFLVLTSQFGTHRVLLGLQNPRRLATKLMRNVCTMAPQPLKAAE